MNLNKNSEQIKELKKAMWRRVILASLFIAVNIASALYVMHKPPYGSYLGILNIAAAVICLPALLMPLFALFVISRSSEIYMDDPELPDAAPLSEIIADVRSRFLFKVKGMFSTGTEMCDLIRQNGIEIIEYHLDKLRAEAVLTFAALNDAKGARNILKFNNYNCTEVEEFKHEQ